MIDKILKIINDKVIAECFSRDKYHCEDCALVTICIAGQIKNEVNKVINEQDE